MIETERMIREWLRSVDVREGDFFEREVAERMEHDAMRRWQHTLQSGDVVSVIRSRMSFDSLDNSIYPIGHEGYVVGFAIESVKRFRQYQRLESGIYVDKEWVYVKCNEHEVRLIRNTSLEMTSEQLMRERIAQSRQHTPDARDLQPIKLRDLPETTFWEDDIVAIHDWDNIEKPTHIESDPYHPNTPHVYKIWDIKWCKQGEIVETLDKIPRYTLTDRWHKAVGGSLMDFQMKLVARGNVWRAHHDEPLIFADLAEEAAYRKRMAECARTGVCYTNGKEKEEALKRIAAGEGHSIKYFDDFHGWYSTTGWELITFNDEQLGERLKKATLEEGFTL